MSSDELDACPYPQEDVKEFTAPSSRSQSNDCATHLISSLPIRTVVTGCMSPRNPDEPNQTCPYSVHVVCGMGH